MKPSPLQCEEIQDLGSNGFFIRDDFLGDERARAIHKRACALNELGLLRPSRIGRWGSRRMDSVVRSDHALWLDPRDPTLSVEVTDLMKVFAWLQAELNQNAYLGLRRFDVQLSQFTPYSRYERHFDSFSGPANRRATAIYYLNAEWRAEDGGSLRIHTDGSFRDVEPILDRLIVFASERLEHEVLEVFKRRLAITAWYYAGPG